MLMDQQYKGAVICSAHVHLDLSFVSPPPALNGRVLPHNAHLSFISDTARLE